MVKTASVATLVSLMATGAFAICPDGSIQWPCPDVDYSGGTNPPGSNGGYNIGQDGEPWDPATDFTMPGGEFIDWADPPPWDQTTGEPNTDTPGSGHGEGWSTNGEDSPRGYLGYGFENGGPDHDGPWGSGWWSWLDCRQTWVDC